MQTQVGIAASRGEEPQLPRLLIDARPTAPGAAEVLRPLLGLTLLERLVRAARRSGYGEVQVLTERAAAADFRRLLAGIADVHIGEDVPKPGGARARTVCVAAGVLGERRWLEAAASAAIADDGVAPLFAGVVVCGPDVPAAGVAAALAEAGAAGRERAEDAATFIVRDPADLPEARRRLLRALGKTADGFMERHFERPISRRLSAMLAGTRVTPNQLTLLSAAVGLAAAPFFLSAAPLWQTMGALLFLVHAILDGCDGELARLKFRESRWGGILDFWTDNVVHAAIFGCMAAGWSRAAGADWPLALGAAAVLGTLGSAGFVYWRVMHPKRTAGPLYTSVSHQPSGRLTQLLDSLSRRDFIYLVLILSVPGKAAWFLALAAVGAPIFFVMLLVVAAKDRRIVLAVNA